MARLIASVATLAALFGGVWLVNWLTSPDNNITCKYQQGVQYVLCVAGQGDVYVPYSAWRSASVGGYYDRGSRVVYRTVDDDPHVSHGLFSGDDDTGTHHAKTRTAHVSGK